jgi:hypothetical protein
MTTLNETSIVSNVDAANASGARLLTDDEIATVSGGWTSGDTKFVEGMVGGGLMQTGIGVWGAVGAGAMLVTAPAWLGVAVLTGAGLVAIGGLVMLADSMKED